MPNDDTVHFGRPPLTEVALSFQFEPLAAYGYAEIGLLREHFRATFPRIEYHPALPPSFETFGPPSALPFLISYPFAMPGGVPRVWLLDDRGVEILQFQPDRFTRNWRKIEEGAKYPHYQAVRTAFLADLESLERFLDGRSLGRLVPNQCEVTYVNQIAAPGGFGEVMGRVFTNWKSLGPTDFGELDSVAFSTGFVLRTDEGDPAGRMYFHASSAFDQLKQPIVQLVVVGRGAPRAPTIEAATDFLDLAHARILSSFLELTTPEIHAQWERA